MSEMVERVARALYDDRVGEDAAWPSESHHTRYHFRRQARSAIEAMMKPTEAMVRAAHAEFRVADVVVYDADVMDAYSSMITAALDTQAVGQKP